MLHKTDAILPLSKEFVSISLFRHGRHQKFFINSLSFFLFLSLPTASPSCPRSLRLHPTPSLPATLPAWWCHRTHWLLWFDALEGPLPWKCGLLPAGVRQAHLPLPMTCRLDQVLSHSHRFINEPSWPRPSHCSLALHLPIHFWSRHLMSFNWTAYYITDSSHFPVMPPVNHEPCPSSHYRLLKHVIPQLHCSLNVKKEKKMKIWT